MLTTPMTPRKKPDNASRRTREGSHGNPSGSVAVATPPWNRAASPAASAARPASPNSGIASSRTIRGARTANTDTAEETSASSTASAASASATGAFTMSPPPPALS